MTKIEILTELVGENMCDLVAYDLQQSLKDIKDMESKDYIGPPMYSYEDDIEAKKLKKLRKAFERVLSYYTVEG